MNKCAIRGQKGFEDKGQKEPPTSSSSREHFERNNSENIFMAYNFQEHFRPSVFFFCITFFSFPKWA